MRLTVPVKQVGIGASQRGNIKQYGIQYSVVDQEL